MKRIGLIFALGTLATSIMIIICTNNIFNAYNHSKHIEKVTSANKKLTKLKRESNEIFDLQKSINQFYGLISETKINPNNSELSILCTDFFNNGYNFINLRFFDKNKNRITVKRNNENDSLNGAIQRLYTALATSKLDKDSNLLRKYRSLIETLLGAVDINSLAQQPSTLIPVTLSGKPAYFYWNVYENSANENNISGMVAWIKRSEIPSKFFYQKLVEKFNKEAVETSSLQTFGFIDTNGHGFVYPESMTNTNNRLSYSDLYQKIQELKASLRSNDKIENNIFNYIDLGGSCYFFCITHDPANDLEKILTIILEVILIAVAIYMSGFIYSFTKMQEYEKSYIPQSIFYYLRANFLFIMLLILFLALVNSFIRNNAVKSNKDMIYSNIYSVIDWVNDGYETAIKDLTQKMLALSKEESVSKLDSKKLDSINSKLCQEHRLSRMFITDKDGKILYSYPSNNNGIFAKFIPVVARKIVMERLSSEENWKSKIEGLMMDSVSKSFADLVGENSNILLKAFENHNEATEFELGQKRQIVFSTIINSDSKAPKVLITWLDSEEFSNDYFINKIKDSENLPDNIKQTTLAIIPIQLDKKPYPREIVKYSFSRDITEKVAFTKRPTQFETSVGGQNFLGVGTTLKILPNYVVFGLQRSEE